MEIPLGPTVVVVAAAVLQAYSFASGCSCSCVSRLLISFPHTAYASVRFNQIHDRDDRGTPFFFNFDGGGYATV